LTEAHETSFGVVRSRDEIPTVRLELDTRAEFSDGIGAVTQAGNDIPLRPDEKSVPDLL